MSLIEQRRRRTRHAAAMASPPRGPQGSQSSSWRPKGPLRESPRLMMLRRLRRSQRDRVDVRRRLLTQDEAGEAPDPSRGQA